MRHLPPNPVPARADKKQTSEPPFVSLHDLLPGDIRSSQDPAIRGAFVQNSIEDLWTYLRRYRLTSGLNHLGAISNRLFKGPPQEKHGAAGVLFTQFGADFLAKELIRVGSDLSL